MISFHVFPERIYTLCRPFSYCFSGSVSLSSPQTLSWRLLLRTYLKSWHRSKAARAPCRCVSFQHWSASCRLPLTRSPLDSVLWVAIDTKISLVLCQALHLKLVIRKSTYRHIVFLVSHIWPLFSLFSFTTDIHGHPHHSCTQHQATSVRDVGVPGIPCGGTVLFTDRWQHNNAGKRCKVFHLNSTFMQTLVQNSAPTLSSLSSSLQNGGECLRAYVSVALEQIAQWRDEQGNSGLWYVMQVVNQLLDPRTSEFTAAFVGRLVSTLISRAGTELGEQLDQILRAILSKMQQAETLSVMQVGEKDRVI